MSGGDNSKEFKTMQAAENLIKEFENAIDDKIFRKLRGDDSLLFSKFNIVEENIVKLMDKRHISQNELVKVQDSQLIELQVKNC